MTWNVRLRINVKIFRYVNILWLNWICVDRPKYHLIRLEKQWCSWILRPSNAHRRRQRWQRRRYAVNHIYCQTIESIIAIIIIERHNFFYRFNYNIINTNGVLCMCVPEFMNLSALFVVVIFFTMISPSHSLCGFQQSFDLYSFLFMLYCSDWYEKHEAFFQFTQCLTEL